MTTLNKWEKQNELIITSELKNLGSKMESQETRTIGTRQPKVPTLI